ncbi:hypothetical protein [Nocardiopsis sp. CC223A]|uniref:hypothetical protein n=1 Tax=Nocardiopsis sp. CC223A TaxID=3044051 RepID=UPI00278C0A6C|nr:hypothetical protein [Nocardiopsis sp. CC223A]
MTDPVDVLRRREEHGGAWRVVARTDSEVTVSLCRCDGGEETERPVSGDPAPRAFAAAHR